MSTITLPFKPEDSSTESKRIDHPRNYWEALPDELRKAADNHPHLLNYLKTWFKPRSVSRNISPN